MFGVDWLGWCIFAWRDNGAKGNRMEAVQFIQTLEHRQGFKIVCLEGITWGNQWISSEALR